MKLTAFSSSAAMYEIACQPSRIGAIDMCRLYDVARSRASKVLGPLHNLCWIQTVEAPEIQRKRGRPVEFFKPTELFYQDYAQVYSEVQTRLLTDHVSLKMHEDALEAIYAHDRTTEDSNIHSRTRALAIGNAVMLAERIDLQPLGWFNDSQSWLSLLAITALSERQPVDGHYTASA